MQRRPPLSVHLGRPDSVDSKEASNEIDIEGGDGEVEDTVAFWKIDTSFMIHFELKHGYESQE